MKKSTQVAIGGLSAALCLLMMFMTGLVPFSSYLFPAMAGIVLIAVADEMGVKTALLVYAVVSVLAILIVPDQEAKLLFILFLGYYPMLKPVLEKLPRLFSFFIKLAVFNGIIVAFYGMSMSEGIDAKKIMADLSLALEATGAGLLVAIPTLIAYNGLLRKIDILINRYKAKQ